MFDFSTEAIDRAVGRAEPGEYHAVVAAVTTKSTREGKPLLAITWAPLRDRAAVLIEDAVALPAAGVNLVWLEASLRRIQAVLAAGERPLQHPNLDSLCEALVGVEATVTIGRRDTDKGPRPTVEAVAPIPESLESGEVNNDLIDIDF